MLLYEKRKKNEDFSTIPKSQYKSFVNGIKRDFYVFTIYEITALHIERAMNRYAGKYSLGIKAVPYPFALAKTNRKQFKRLIRQQIKNGYPVIFSAGCKWPDTVKEKNKAKMYEQDREGTYISFTPLENSFMYDHYVSITGVLTDRQKGTLRYQVSSGGKKYYIDYDELCTYMDNYGSDWTCDAIFVYRNQ